MSLQTIDLIVPDVLSAASFFTDIVELRANVLDERFAELDAGAITIMLSPDAMVPVDNAAGVILHFQVDDVGAAADKASAAGAKVLKEPFTTDWGWESCLIAGPAGVVVDFYRPTEQRRVLNRLLVASLSSISVISVENLGKTYTVPEREAGVKAAVVWLFNRKTRNVYAVQIVDPLGVPESEIIIDPRLRERHCGAAEGLLLEERRAQQPDDIWPEAETPEMMDARTDPTMQNLAEKHVGKRVVLVAHGSWIRSALRVVSNYDPEILEIVIPNASCSRVSYDAGTWKIGEPGIADYASAFD